MRTLTSPQLANLTTQYGSEPLIVVKIEWTSGTVFYSDKSATGCTASILDLSNIATALKQETVGEVSAVNISLDDIGGSIKTLIDTNRITGTKCTVYLSFTDFDESSAITILVGRIASDVEWDEGSRKISFTIDTAYSTEKLGFAPTDLVGLSKDAIGKFWPIVFGSCLKVPAVQIYKDQTGTYAAEPSIGATTIYVSDGDTFPQSTSIKLRLRNGRIVQGTFAGQVFTVTSDNLPYHESISFAARPGGDPDAATPAVAWITGTKNIVGQYCMVDMGAYKVVNFCTKQEGTKCTFVKGWKRAGQYSSLLMSDTVGVTIVETSYFQRASWGVTMILETLDSSGVWAPWFGYWNASTVFKHDVTLFTGLQPTYVVNSAPTTIKSVYAFRSHDGIKTLEPVPSSYYTKNLSTTISGQSCATLTFYSQLSDYTDQGWEDTVYVTQTSSLGNNTSDIIKWLIETYTDYTVDATSFASVATKITAYPSNFALLEAREVLDLISDIAYQARLAVIYTSGVAKLVYLSETPASYTSFADSSILQNSLSYGFTSKDDIVTRVTSSWRRDYVNDEAPYVYTSNEDIYGTEELEQNIFIYTHYNLVKLTTDFWGNRKANSWRTIDWSGFLDAIKLECFDTVAINTPTYTLTNIRGEVSSINYDSLANRVTLSATMASKSGTLTEDTSFWTVPSISAISDPTDGTFEIDYVVSVPTELRQATQPDVGIVITKFPEKIIRGVPFEIGAEIRNQDDSIRLLTSTFPISISESNDVDSINASTITFTNGKATLTITASGGTLETHALINITGKQIGNTLVGTGISSSVPITSEGEIVITIAPVANRDELFDVVISAGTISGTYGVSITTTDPTEILVDETNTPVTSITLDGTGAYTGTWKFTEGTYALDGVIITFTSPLSNEYTKQVTVVDTGTGAGNLVVRATFAGDANDLVMNNGSGWAVFDENTYTDAYTIGIIGYVISETEVLIVCRGLMCIAGLTEHTTYYGVMAGLSTTGNIYVLRSYENDLCWIGGGGNNRLNKLYDVDAAGLVDKSLLMWDDSVTKWVNLTLDSSDDSIAFAYTSLTIDLTINKVGIAKIADVPAASVICNPTDAVANATSITGADYTVLKRGAGVLGFGKISNEWVADTAAIIHTKIDFTGYTLDWSQLVNVPSLASAGHGHTLTGVVSGTLSATTIAAGQITNTMLVNSSITLMGTATALGGSWSPANSSITNVMLANSQITINGTPVSLGGSISISSGMSNPMTTSGDLIKGGSGGTPTRLAVNSGGTTQFVRSKSGVTDLATLSLANHEDCDVAGVTDWQPLCYSPTLSKWVNSNTLVLGKDLSPTYEAGDITVFIGTNGDYAYIGENGIEMFDISESTTVPKIKFGLAANDNILGIDPGSGTRTVSDLKIVVSTDGDYVKISSVGIEYYDASISTSIPMIKLAVGSGTLNATARALTIREIDVCDAGVMKKMQVLASAPY